VTMRVQTSQSRGAPYHHPWLDSDARGHLTSLCLAASWGVEIHCLERPSIRAGAHARHLILSASIDASRKAQRRRPHLYDGVLSQARNLLGSPPPGPRPRCDAASAERLYVFEYRSHGYHAGLEETPECNEELTGYGNNANPSQALAPVPKALTKPAT
jgi:hypothetical protein